MADQDRIDAQNNDPVSAEEDLRRGRRKVLIGGALLIPTIATLHGTPAWAQTDYTMTAYKYGMNAGKCRNPHYDLNAPPGSHESEEFVTCTKGLAHEDDPGESQQDSGAIVF